MTLYRVTTTIEVEADDRTEAALRAYSLINDLTPNTFSVTDPASVTKEIILTESQQEDALARAFSGSLFPSV